MSELKWFRLHTNSVDNVKLRMLAFEDRWHYIAICCLKADGLLEKSDDKNFSTDDCNQIRHSGFGP
jgi:hypothetical protein